MFLALVVIADDAAVVVDVVVTAVEKKTVVEEANLICVRRRDCASSLTIPSVRQFYLSFYVIYKKLDCFAVMIINCLLVKRIIFC